MAGAVMRLALHLAGTVMANFVMANFVMTSSGMAITVTGPSPWLEPW